MIKYSKIHVYLAIESEEYCSRNARVALCQIIQTGALTVDDSAIVQLANLQVDPLQVKAVPMY
jgi:hypothetical protein